MGDEETLAGLLLALLESISDEEETARTEGAGAATADEISGACGRVSGRPTKLRAGVANTLLPAKS